MSHRKLPVPKTVMISYEGNSQSLAFRIRDFLENKGLKVLIDTEGIRSEFLQWKGDAVKSSDAVILLLTPKYEQSKNCLFEAKLAHELGKKIIPLVG